MSLNHPVLQEYLRTLPFSVHVARSLPELAGACSVRADSYARHGYPAEVVERMRKVDLLDGQARVLVAKDHNSGEILGTLAVFCSLDGTPPIPNEFGRQEVGPESFMYLSRLGVVPGEHASAVTAALFKAVLKLAVKDQVQWVLAASLPTEEPLFRGFGLRVLQGNESGFKHPGDHPGRFRGLGERLASLIKFAHQLESPLRDFILVKHSDIKV